MEPCFELYESGMERLERWEFASCRHYLGHVKTRRSYEGRNDSCRDHRAEHYAQRR